MEALTNDATGIILFNFFSDLAKDEHAAVLTWNFVFTDIIIAAIGGIAIGHVFQIICQRWLKLVYNDNVNIINLMFVTSFLVFVISESSTVKCSGIFALITLGLELSKNQGTTIDKKTRSAIHGFYNYAMYFSETLIFITVGIFIGYSYMHDR